MQKFNKIRMGMVGGGQGAFIGAVHRMAAALDGQIDLVCGAFSQSLDNTIETGLSLGLDSSRLYLSYKEMFAAEAQLPEDQRMEFVAIVTPNHLHVPISMKALESGFHVMCDKPAGISVEEVANLRTAVQQSELLYGLTHTYAGYPMVWQARHLAQTNQLGELKKIHVEYPQGWLAKALESEGSKQASWRTDPQKAGLSGCMGDIGTHAHHLAEFISGQRVLRLSARLNCHVNGRLLDDDGTIMFDMDGGITGTLIASQVCAGEENALKINVYGSEGGVEWSQMAPNTLQEKRPSGIVLHRAGVDKPLCDEALARCRLPSGHPEGYLEAFANLYRDFAQAIRHKKDNNLPGIDDGLRGMTFLQALVDSHNQSSAWVNVPTIA